MPAPTNIYYQRAFNALAGTLARARQMVNEFALIQRGFDLIGDYERTTKYQLSCSDLETALTPKPLANYFRAQRALELSEVRASLAVASSSGPVEIGITMNGAPLLSTNITIDQGERTSETAAVPPVLAITEVPDDSEFVVEIISGGTGAKGLIVSVIGRLAPT
jgi:hypothetical protein